MLKTLPIGLLVLFGVLLAEFNSFRRVAIILFTVPLAATGVVPGLLIAGQPFGFMSLLGVFALVGIVVNNAIVLLELVERRRREGAPIDEALRDAVQQRIRPILLTTATTVAGLMPLALSPSTLWPPLAWAMISGLIASTLLTLVVVPALYRVLLRRPSLRWMPALRRRLRLRTRRAATLLLLALLLPAGTVALAQEDATAEPGAAAVRDDDAVRTLDLADAMRLGAGRPAAAAADADADSVDELGLSLRRLSYLPTIGGALSESDRDRELELDTPLGSFPFGAQRVSAANLSISQPIFDPARLLHGNKATRLETRAARESAARTDQELAAEAARAWLQLLAVEASLGATDKFIESLAERLREIEARVEAGRALEADMLKVKVLLESARLDRVRLLEARDVAAADLARVTGSEGPVAAGPAPEWRERAVPDESEMAERAVAQRRDLAALETRTDALDRRRRAVLADRIPRVDARVSWTWTEGSPYTTTNWTEGAVVATWVPFASGSRGPRARSIAARQSATQLELVEARRAVRVEVRAALAELVAAREAVLVRQRGVEQTEESLRVDRARFVAGRITTNDLLEVEAALRDQLTLLELAKLEVVRAWVRLWLAVGDDDPAMLT
jgi:outer membrane protein TolC